MSMMLQSEPVCVLQPPIPATEFVSPVIVSAPAAQVFNAIVVIKDTTPLELAVWPAQVIVPVVLLEVSAVFVMIVSMLMPMELVRP